MQIFDLRNPILRQDAALAADGSLKVLSKAQTAARFTNLFKAQAAPVARSIAAQRLRLTTIQKNTVISDTLMRAMVQVSGAGTPWTPVDKDWADMGDYFEDVAEINDPIQGSLSDCYFIAALA